MSDFQSFLLQSMQLIGLKEDNSSIDSCSNSSTASNTDLTTTHDDSVSSTGGGGGGVCNNKSNFSRKKLNTIEEPPELNTKISTVNVKKEVSSRQSSVSSSKNANSSTTLTTNKTTSTTSAAIKKPSVKEQKIVDSPELKVKSNAINNEKADTISQLHQNSMGNISICTTETFISTNSNSTNLTNVTASSSSSNEEQPSKKYTTIVESDTNNDCVFPDPPKFITETEKEDRVDKNQDSGSCAKDSISVNTQSTDSIVCVNKMDESIDYNDNKQMNDKIIENKDVIFEICSLSSSINCLDQDLTPVRMKNNENKDGGGESNQQQQKTEQMEQNITYSIPSAIDESFIDNNGYNNNMSNFNATLMNTSTYDNERDVKSPKPVVESISQRILKKISNGDFSPLKSIFNKHYQNKNNGIKPEKSESSISGAKPQPPPIPPPPAMAMAVDPKLMESYLAKFEEEILRKAKTEILNECKLLTAKQNEVNNKNDESKLIKKYLEGNQRQHIEETEENTLELMMNNDMDNLEKYNSLITRIRFNSKKRYMTLPLLYNYFNERIDAVQINKWLKTMEKASVEKKIDVEVDAEEKEPSKVSSKQYLINKKRELLDKVAKKMHHHKKVPRITLNDNQLYANVDFTTESVTETLKTTTTTKKNRKKKGTNRKESPVNESHDGPILNDGFYINEKLNQHVKRQQVPLPPPPPPADDERTKRTKRKPRPKSEVKSIEENSSMLRDITPSDESTAAFDESEKNRAREKKSRSNVRKSSALKEVEDMPILENDDEEDLRVQKVNIRRKKTTTKNQTLSNDHFYNEINEVELRNTVKTMKDRKSEEKETTIKKNTTTKPRTSSSSAALATTTTTTASPSTKKITESHSLTTLKKPSAAESAKTLLRKPLITLAKIKSPERKILYNEWFSIIKKMDTDPKFDLEALVRTRGRFTEHDRISYRDRLQQQQKLRSARSEPNFAAMNFFAQNSEQSQSDDSQGEKKKIRKPAKHIDFDAKRERSRPHRTVNLCRNNNNNTNNDAMRSESYGGNMHNKWNGEDNLAVTSSGNEQQRTKSKHLEVPGTLSNALKLTLHKSDVEMIKEILKKKNKNLSAADLNTLALNAIKGKGSSDADLNTKRRSKVPIDDADDIPAKTMKTITRRGVNKEPPIPSSECENEVEIKATKTTHRTRHSNELDTKRRRDKSNRPLKHESGASSSLIDESKEDDSSLISKCKNLTQIAKTDGAKGLCDELGKMMKGRILKGHSKLVSKINEIGSSIHFEKKHTSSRTEISVSRSPPPRPEPPKTTTNRRTKEHHVRKNRGREEEEEEGGGGETRVKKDHIEKWMQNVKSAANNHHHHHHHHRDHRHRDQSISVDEISDDNEGIHEDKLSPPPPVRRHHRKLSNINEDSINDGSESRHQSRNMRTMNKPRQRKSTHHNEEEEEEEDDENIKKFKSSPKRPAPPKRPPPPRPSSPEGIAAVSSVHDRLMRDMNKMKKTTTAISSSSRHNLTSNSNQSINSSSHISGYESPEPVSSRRQKPKLPAPPPRPPSKPNRHSVGGGYESEEQVKYSNTKRTTQQHRNNNNNHETMNAMIEYQIDAHNESKLKAKTTTKTTTTTTKRHHHHRSHSRVRSPSPVVVVAAAKQSSRHHQQQQQQQQHRHRSSHQPTSSVSPDRRRRQQKPPIHR